VASGSEDIDSDILKAHFDDDMLFRLEESMIETIIEDETIC
jgi:hypothetical protein